MILNKKLSTTLDEICYNCPSEICTYIKYCRDLEFSAIPDYNYVFSLFQNVMKRENINLNDWEFEWLNLDVDHHDNTKSDINNKSIPYVTDDVNKTFNLSSFNKLNLSIEESSPKKPNIKNSSSRKESAS